MKPSIPKRIIQTGKSRDLSLTEQAMASNIRLLNPDFEYLFFDNSEVEDFIDTHFPMHREVFDSFPVRIQKYDFFRYLAIYKFGGFYFDLDVLLASGLHQLLPFGCVFPFEELTLHAFLRRQYGMDWEVGNYAFGASADHPFLAAVIENCIKAQRHPEWATAMIGSIPRPFRAEFYVLVSTGPGMVSRTLAEFEGAADQITVLFPDDVCDTRNWHCFGTYGVHLQSGSWRTTDGFLRRRLSTLWERGARRSMLKESLRNGRTRSLHLQRSSAPLKAGTTKLSTDTS